jgi:hypothetical protein
MIDSPRTNTFPLVRAPRIDEVAERTLPELMLDLVGRLTTRAGRTAAESPRGAVHRYRDADFEYVEMALNGIEDVEADICIHGGRIFVRIVR